MLEIKCFEDSFFNLDEEILFLGIYFPIRLEKIKLKTQLNLALTGAY